MTTELQELKVSLAKTIQKWIDYNCERDGWDAVTPNYVGNRLTELMTDSAFNILLAQIDVNEYLQKENLIAD